MTVVATSTSSSPAAKARIAASFSSALMRPCSGATRLSAKRGCARELGEHRGDGCRGHGGIRLAVAVGRLPVVLGDARLDRGADHEALPAQLDLLGEALPDARTPAGTVGERHDVRLDAGAAGGELADRRHVEVAEDGHRDGARDGRGGEHEHVRRMLPLQPQRLALLDAESVLLVDDDEPEVGERHGVADERVRADDDARLAGGGAEQRLPAVGGRQLAGEQRRHEPTPTGRGRACARSIGGAARRAPRWARAARTARRSRPPRAWPAARRPSCPSRPRPGRAGSSAPGARGRRRSRRRPPAGRR